MMTFSIHTLTYIMNLLAKRFGYAILLALFFSCEDPNEIGLNINPDLQNLNILKVEIPLEASTIRLDSVRTSFSGRLNVGKLNDSEFGNTVATGYSEVKSSTFNPNLADDTEFDSLTLKIALDYFYGDGIDQPQIIHVHQLNQLLDDDRNYYSFDKEQVPAETIGAFEFTVAANHPDTLNLSIKLDDMLGKQLFDSAKTSSEIFGNFDNFDEFFFGLGLVPDDANSMLFGINMQDPNTVMQLHYSDADDTVSQVINFSLNGNAATHSYYSNFEYDRSGTGLAGLTEFNQEFTTTDNDIFMQSGSAIYPKINLDALRSFIENNEIKVSRADLIIDQVSPFVSGLEPPERFFMFLTDDSNRFLRIDLNDTTNTSPFRAIQSEFSIVPFGSGMEAEASFDGDADNNYEGRMTLFVQLGIIDGFLQEPQDLLLVPFRFSSTMNRVSFNQSNVKVRLFYTPLSSN